MNDLIVQQERIPALFSPGGLADLIAKIEAEARSIAPDVSTKKGRDTIRSTAAKVAKTKTYLDGLGKDLTADLKRQTAAVDAERKQMRDRLDALKDEVRRPLTEWEQAEENRIAEHRSSIEAIISLAQNIPAESSIADLSHRLSVIETTELGPQWDEFEAEAARAKETARSTLIAAIETAKRREAEQAELARLRAEAIARDQKEREERIAREAAERAKSEAERIAREAAEAVERKAQAERMRAENERLQAERDRAEAERRALEAEQRAKQAAEDAERRARQAEEDAKRREQLAAEQERARAKAEADRIAAEAAKRAADEAHALKIKREVALAIMLTSGVTVDQAKAIVLAIIRGDVPHTEIRF